MKKYVLIAAFLLPATGAMAQNSESPVGTVTFVNNGTTQMAFSPDGTSSTGCINGGQGAGFTIPAGSTNVSIYSATCNQGQAGSFSNLSTLSLIGAGCTYPFTCTSPTACAFGSITCPSSADLSKALKSKKKETTKTITR